VVDGRLPTAERVVVSATPQIASGRKVETAETKVNARPSASRTGHLQERGEAVEWGFWWQTQQRSGKWNCGKQSET
jgi:hypothetical protein